jgi:hypothetical protein
MQAAGRSIGKCYNWSSIKAISGLITIDMPCCFPIMIDETIYVKDFPLAVYDMKIVDSWLSVF